MRRQPRRPAIGAWLQARRAALPPALARRYTVMPWVGAELAGIYAAGGLVVSRAGAGTVNECCQLGVPALYIPLPGASGDEQTANARLVDRRRRRRDPAPGRAVAGGPARAACRGCSADPGRLKEMGERARALAIPDAAERLVDLLLEIGA